MASAVSMVSPTSYSCQCQHGPASQHCEVCAGRPQSSPGGGPHPTVPLSAKVSVCGALCTLVGRGGGEVCGGISCSPAQQHGTACGVAAVEELSVVQWELHIVYSSPQCAMAAL